MLVGYVFDSRFSAATICPISMMFCIQNKEWWNFKQMLFIFLQFRSWWLYFFSKRELTTLKTLVSFSQMLYFALLRFISKGNAQILSKLDEQKFSVLTPISALSSSSCNANYIRRRFLITQILAMKLWVRIPFHIGDSPPTLSTICEPTFTNVLAVWCQLYEDLKLADIKLKTIMAPNFLKSEENLSWDITFSVKMRF